MTDISNIKGLLDWKLLSGSHDWPGPDGGTCINEAAIVVAGFEYTPVGGAEDFPACFSKELGMLLLTLNDELSDERRQKLMRFVLKLPGSRDAARVERERCRYLREGACRLLDASGLAHEPLPRRMRTREDRLLLIEQLAASIGWVVERSYLAGETRDRICDEMLDVIDQAFSIGRRGGPHDAALVERRLAEARAAWASSAA